MARRRRARRNPRNSKGRFVKRARRNPTAKRRRRAKRANPTVRRKRRRARANPSPVRRRRRRVRRVARANPSPIRRRRRRARRNPMSKGVAQQHAAVRRGLAPKARKNRKRRTTKQIAATNKMIRANRGGLAKRRAKSKRRSGSKRRWRKVSKGMRIVRRYKSKIRRAGKKRSLRRAIARVQYHRASVIRRAGSKSVVAKAMHLKMNPGFAGVMASAKVLVPQGAVAAGAMIGLAMGGKAIAARVTAHAPAALVPYVPAIATLGLTGLGYVIADKVAPKFKGAVAIGGIIGAIVQAIVASTSAFGVKVQAALLGEYTMVGGGIFRGDGSVGEYTMVGDAGRPRGDLRDNGTNWALNGADDNNTDFAPGEGGVLSGSGIFRG